MNITMSKENSKRKYVPIRKEKNDCTFWFLSPLMPVVQQPCTTKCGFPHINPSDTECRYRPLVSLGLIILQILRRIFLPSSVCGFIVVHAKENDERDVKCDPSRKLVRACDLPVYAKEKKCINCAPTKEPESDLFVETVKCARKEIWFLMDQARIVQRQMGNCLEELKKSSKEGLDYLREESNVVPRMGAIAVGGLSGYILALRRGFFRKLLYTSIGAGGMAALCYPREAKEYSHEAVQLMKRYIIIGYHFLNGDEVDYDKLLNENQNVKNQEIAADNEPGKETEVKCDTPEKHKNEAECRCLRHHSNANLKKNSGNKESSPPSKQ
uniref:MICOS complex subunit n=1 Tax=Triatoma infestans TaxID=30076 RepID=A0A170ZIY9_TRIIF